MLTLTPPTLSWDPVWETIFASRPWGKYPPEAIVRSISRAFANRPQRNLVKILDLGCGPGACSWFLAREGYRTYGIDGSPSAIRIAQERLVKEDLSADLRVGDFTEPLPWADRTFDAVIDCASLYSNPLCRIKAAMGEIHRVLKPDGLAVSMTFSDRTWGYGLGEPGPDANSFIEVSEGPLAGKGHVQFFDRHDLDELFAEFAQVKVERSSHTLEEGEQLIDMWVVEARTRR